MNQRPQSSQDSTETIALGMAAIAGGLVAWGVYALSQDDSWLGTVLDAAGTLLSGLPWMDQLSDKVPPELIVALLPGLLTFAIVAMIVQGFQGDGLDAEERRELRLRARRMRKKTGRDRWIVRWR